MRPDREGFLRPIIDDTRCVDCHVCEKVCPVLNSGKPRHPIAVYAAAAKDNELRLMSSSGGIFTLLARDTLSQGGVVFGAALDYVDCSVQITDVSDEQGLGNLRGSKYVQANVGGAYRRVKILLDEDRKVLYTGTPCQIAALRSVLNKEYENLLCAEVICHAVPSPLAFRMYIKARERSAEAKVKHISFRDKKYSWKRYYQTISFHSSGYEYSQPVDRDAFLRGFLTELYNRPSCHNCQFRELKSGADLTIGDFWDVDTVFRELTDDKGTSLVLVNTRKGQAAFCEIQPYVEARTSDYESACRTNSALVKSRDVNPNRGRFFRWAKYKFIDFDWLVKVLTMKSLFLCCRNGVKVVVRRLVKCV